MEKAKQLGALLIRNAKATFSLYTSFPVSEVSYDESSTQYITAFLPMTGVPICLVTILAAMLLRTGKCQSAFAGAILLLIPLLISGGVHLEGFMKCSDALAADRKQDERLAVLRDAHLGSYAVMDLCMFFLLFFGSFCQIWNDPDALPVMAMAYIMSRAFLGLMILLCPVPVPDDMTGYLRSQANTEKMKWILIGWIVAVTAGMAAFRPLYGLVCLDVGILHFLWFRRCMVRQFGGNNESLGGSFLCRTEMLTSLALAFLTVWIR